jgi:hypothetical protein
VFISGPDSKPVLAGDTAHLTMMLINLHDSDILIDSIVTGIGQNINGGQEYQKWLDDTTGILVAARDTLRVRFDASASKPGGFGIQIDLYTNAGLTGVSLSFTVYPSVPFWDEFSYLFLRDCERDIEGDVAIHYYNRSATTIDSVIGLTAGWYLVDPVQNVELPGESNFKVKVVRRKYVMDPGMFILYAKDTPPDTLSLGVYVELIKPRLLPESDTTYIDHLPNESKFTALIAKNVGYGGYRLRPAEYTPSEAWTLQPIDTTEKVIVSATMQVILQFQGQAVEGDYPITVTLRPDMCDTFMTKTVIARVRKLSSVISTQSPDIKVWPQPARERITIDAAMPFDYELLDILGTVRVSGRSSESTNELDLTSLEAGTYILRCKLGSSYVSRTVTITR